MEEEMRMIGAAFLALVPMLVACSPEAGRAIPVDQICVLSSGDLCRIPYSLLFSSRNDLVGREVGIRGYLIKENDEFVLYENHVSAAMGGREAAVLISAGGFYEDSDRLIGQNVIVVGKLGLNKDGWWSEISLTKSPGEVPIWK
ncbi:hypothetical protein [Luteimonas sp. A501]